jgi:hypothetical protein
VALTDDCFGKMREVLEKFEQNKARFTEIQEAYVADPKLEHLPKVDRVARMLADSRTQEAISNCDWFGRQVEIYSAAFLAARERERQREEQLERVRRPRTT